MVFCFFFLLGSTKSLDADDLIAVGQRKISSNVLEDNPTNSLGSWIWADRTFDRQTCLLWRSFEIPPRKPVTHARLLMTVDNEFSLFLDGRELGRGAEWRELFDYNVAPLMSPGKHVFAVKAYNSATFAGMIFGLHIDFADGSFMEIKSDQNWLIVPEEFKGWEKKLNAAAGWLPATVKAPLGGDPWWKIPQGMNLMPTLQPIKIHFWETAWFQTTLITVSIIIILISLRLVAQLAMHRKEQWLLQQERARIARDIHDDLGSRMTRLVLQGEVSQSDLSADSETRRQLEKICEQARGILSTMDEILWAVNPKRDAFRDFTSYVCGYVQEFLKPTGIQCLFDIDPAVSDVVLNLPLKRSFLMVIKEALNNAVKHSEATELKLQIKWQFQKLVLSISDNGKGFDQTRPKMNRNGLTNMAQRMKELGGILVVASQPGKGCRVEFSVPFKSSRWPAMSFFWKWQQYPRSTDGQIKSAANESLQTHGPTNH